MGTRYEMMIFMSKILSVEAAARPAGNQRKNSQPQVGGQEK